jgi:4-amino-4-deoxy-L-arabinose transferase-like glycosyltransferase
MRRDLRVRVRRQILLLIIIATAIRLAVAATTGLGVDESYMVAAGRVLSLGYFDHPPAAWWLSWGAARLFGTEAPIVVRLPFILLFTLTTWLMGLLATEVCGPRAGFFAALTLNLSPVFGVTTGTWVLPDGPLDCALVAAALFLTRALPARGGAAWRWWSGAGVCTGLALFSKYSAVLTIAGAFGFLLLDRAHRVWLRRPEPYVAAVIALCIFFPVVVWNFDHHWASFAFQGDRSLGARFRPWEPVITLAGELLFVVPWFGVPMIIQAAERFHFGWRPRLLACLAAPPILVFPMISAWSAQRVLFHWAAPGFLMLFPLLGQFAEQRWNRRWMRGLVAGTAGLSVVGMTVIGTQLEFDWLRGATWTEDATVQGLDWTSLRDDLAARALLRPGTIVGVPNWRDAGKIAYALGPDVTVICLNRDARQFRFADPAQRWEGTDVLLLVVDHADTVMPALRPMFTRIDPLPSSSVSLQGHVLKTVTVAIGISFTPGNHQE